MSLIIYQDALCGLLVFMGFDPGGLRNGTPLVYC